MMIAVVGAGGLGGYIGARLAEVGEDDHLLARGAHLAAMRQGGLRARDDPCQHHRRMAVLRSKS
jgi:2-dehydropantoate 2-reductase